jgi:hypothetical protein
VLNAGPHPATENEAMTNATNEIGRTPGDWTLEYDGSLVMAGQIVGIGVEGCGPDHATRQEKKANARLMAAAPDLYDAWVAYLSADEARDHEGTFHAIEAGRAAVRKALGR